MRRGLQGRYVTISTAGEKIQAFVPAPLPPRPPIEWTPELRGKFDQALLALGRLDSVSTLLPDTSLFLHMYVRQEAVLSSKIEGTHVTIGEVLETPDQVAAVLARHPAGVMIFEEKKLDQIPPDLLARLDLHPFRLGGKRIIAASWPRP